MSGDAGQQPTQQTQPRGKGKDGQPAKPVEIPVPKRNEVLDLMRGVIGKRSAHRDSSESA